MTFYDVLEVRSDATADDIRAAYRQLAKEHHPDCRGGSDAKFAELTEAYAVLRDPGSRRAYDQFLARGRRRPRQAAPVPPPEANGRPARPRPPAPPRDVLAPARRVSEFAALLGRLAGAGVRELDVVLGERFAHLPSHERPPSLADILAATEGPAAPKPRPRG